MCEPGAVVASVAPRAPPPTAAPTAAARTPSAEASSSLAPRALRVLSVGPISPLGVRAASLQHSVRYRALALRNGSLGTAAPWPLGRVTLPKAGLLLRRG